MIKILCGTSVAPVRVHQELEGTEEIIEHDRIVQKDVGAGLEGRPANLGTADAHRDDGGSLQLRVGAELCDERGAVLLREEVVDDHEIVGPLCEQGSTRSCVDGLVQPDASTTLA